ncbi:hypothetical protein P3342_001758 [Pyrenophora teres f. teres]|nr:hypothetical protein P3342_001758 [Pyrenophora teres f. teres]
MVALFSRVLAKSSEPASLKPQNSKKLAITTLKDNERPQSSCSSIQKLKAEGSKAKRLRAKHEREEAKKLGLQSSQLAGLLNNSNATLQTLQNFTIQLELAGELPHASPYKTRRRGVVGAESKVAAAPTAPSPPPKTTTRGRTIKIPQRFK